MALRTETVKRRPTSPKPIDLPPGSQEWARWINDHMRRLEEKTGIVERSVLVSNKDNTAVLGLAQRQGENIRETQERIDEANEQIEEATQSLNELVEVTLPALQEDLQENETILEAHTNLFNDSVIPALNAQANAITTINGRIIEIQQEIDDIVVESGGVLIIYSVNTPSGDDYPEGSTWFQWNNPSTREIIGQWNFNGTAWESVTLSNEVIANLDAGKINAGTLDAARIGANTITAEKLLIGSSVNLIPNGAGETGGADAWAEAITWQTLDKPASEVGAFQCAAGQGTLSNAATGQNFWDVQPGAEYVFEVWLKADVPNSRLYIEARDQDGGHAGRTTAIPGETAPGGTGIYLVNNLTVPTTWTRYRWIWIPNASTRKAKIGGVYFNHSAGSERNAVQMIAGMRLRPRASGELLVDGTITGQKIQAGSITASNAVFANGAIVNADIANLNASKINAGILNAARIGAGSIVGEKLAADTITTRELTSENIVGLNIVGSTITGTTITGADITGTNTLTGGSLLVEGGTIQIDDAASMPFSIYRNGNPMLRVENDYLELGSSNYPDERLQLQVFRTSGESHYHLTAMRRDGGNFSGSPFLVGKATSGSNVWVELPTTQLTHLTVLDTQSVINASPYTAGAALISPISRRSYARRGLDTAQSIPSAATTINFTNWDSGHVTLETMTAASGGIRVGLPGVYTIDLALVIGSPSGGISWIVWVNGSAVTPAIGSYALGTFNRLHTTLTLPLGAEDLVQLRKSGSGTGELSAVSTMAVTRVSA